MLVFKTDNVTSKYFNGMVIVIFMLCVFVVSQRFRFGIFSVNSSKYYVPQEMTHTQKRANAFIISQCNSARYNFTVHNLERGFPHFFNYICYTYPLLNDSRIHTSSNLVSKRVSSNLISFADIWTYEIPKHSIYENEWSFVFEDDVDIIEPSQWLSQNKTLSLPNYTNILIELMNDTEVRNVDGFFYLGICGPTFKKTERIIETFHGIINHYKGYGSCAHATAITTKRSRHFWSDLASFRPNPDAAMDMSVRGFSVRSGRNFYTLGANKEMPARTGHFGIVYQNRHKFKTIVW